jgi:hypothetical protein
VGVVVEEEEETGEGEEEDNMMKLHQEDVDIDMVVNEEYVPTETSLTTDDDEDCQWQWPSQSVPITSPCSETDFLSSIQSSTLSPRPQQPPHMRIFPSSDKEVGFSSRPPKPNEMEDYERGHIGTRLDPSQPQPLRRQPAQLMMVPTTSSHGL